MSTPDKQKQPPAGNLDMESDQASDSQSHTEIMNPNSLASATGTTRSGRGFRHSSETESGRDDPRRSRSRTPILHPVAPTPVNERQRTPAQPSSVPQNGPPINANLQNNANPQSTVPRVRVFDFWNSPYLKVLFVAAGILITMRFTECPIMSAVTKTAKLTGSWTAKNRSDYFETKMGTFSHAFPHQDSHTMISLISQIESTIAESEPTQPSAFVVLIPPKMNSYFPICFTKKIGAIINAAFQPKFTQPVKEIDPKTFTKAKDITAIHDELKTYFNSSGKAVVVHEVNKLNRPEHIFVFHSFCDNSMAYEKRATFFFLLQVSEDLYKKYKWNHRSGYELADTILTQAWKNVLDDGSVEALIARVAANVILLNEGDSC